MRTVVLAFVSLAGWGTPLTAQPAPLGPQPADTGLTISLMTFGPGRQVWEQFGHNAIWVHDPADGTDAAYNYGLFDFHQQNFLLRFVRGQMWYWMDGFPAAAYARVYRRDNRSVWIQELDIPLERRVELRRFLEWNAQPEHRFYHYDYYRDNCSTRIRDALDRALDGRLRAATYSTPSHTTFRFHTQRLTANDPLVYTGLLIALGPGVDRPISAWDEAFLPMELRDRIAALRVPGADGRPIPVVKTERTIFLSTAPMPAEAPPDWTVRYLMAGLITGALLVALALLGRRSGAARGGFAALATIWAVATGIAGLVLAGLWGLTDHVMAYRNENLLQLSPLGIAVALVIVPAVRGSPRWGRLTRALAAAVVALSAMGLVLKVLPAFRQVNGPIIAFALPVHLGLLGGVRILRLHGP